MTNRYCVYRVAIADAGYAFQCVHIPLGRRKQWVSTDSTHPAEAQQHHRNALAATPTMRATRNPDASVSSLATHPGAMYPSPPRGYGFDIAVTSAACLMPAVVSLQWSA